MKDPGILQLMGSDKMPTLPTLRTYVPSPPAEPLLGLPYARSFHVFSKFDLTGIPGSVNIWPFAEAPSARHPPTLSE